MSGSDVPKQCRFELQLGPVDLCAHTRKVGASAHQTVGGCNPLTPWQWGDRIEEEADLTLAAPHTCVSIRKLVVYSLRIGGWNEHGSRE